MDILIGLLCGVVLFVVLLGVFCLGFKLGSKNKQHPTIQPVKLTEEQEIQQRKARELQDSFASLMSYDLETALQRKRV